MTQTHTRSATFDPADYRVVAVLDQHDEDGALDIFDGTLETGGLGRNGGSVPTDAFADEMDATEYRCAHCGRRHNLRYIAFVRHVPTGDLLIFGSRCMDDAGLPDATAYARKRAGETKAARERAARIAAARADWEAANPEQSAALDQYVEMRDALDVDPEAPFVHDRFLDDLVKARANYGALTESQTPWPTTAILGWIDRLARDAAKAEVLAAAPVLEDGRREIVGTVRSVRWEDSDAAYGAGSFKMLVELDDANRVWGTVPRSIESADLVGSRVRFVAAVTRSDRDDHFGFYKRPTKATIEEVN